MTVTGDHCVNNVLKGISVNRFLWKGTVEKQVMQIIMKAGQFLAIIASN